jgi:hypothetical protein
MLLQSKNTTTTSPTLQLNPYTQVELKFYFLANGMEAGKKFSVNYANGTSGSFTTIATFTAATTASGTNFVNNTFYVATITMNASSFSSTGRFRIQVAGSDNTDKVYVDAVSVRGRTNTTATGTTVALTGVIKTAMSNGAYSSTGSPIGNPESFGLIVYPNPATNILNIQANAEIQYLRIYTSSGVLVRNYTLKGKGMTGLDIRSFPKGMYILQAEGVEGGCQRLWIKQ